MTPAQIRSLVIAMAVVATFAAGYRTGASSVQARWDAATLEWEKVKREAGESLRKREAALAAAIGPQAGAKYIEELENVKAENDRLLADLRADNVRLRKRWNSCAAGRVAQDADAGRELDEAARLRDESAGRIVRAAAECDAQVRGLQGVVVEIHDRVNAQEHNP
jgi:hypothetical protein